MAGVIIIGSGECGVRGAFALRENGYEDAVTLIGEEPSLPYERPPLSKNIPKTPKPIRTRKAYDDAGIELKLGVHAISIARQRKMVHLSDGSVCRYDKLLLATGARARSIPVFAGSLTLRTDVDAKSIFKHLHNDAKIGIVGGGFVGLELAATARKAGADVTVVEAAPSILRRAVPEEIASILHARHKAEGVALMTATDVEKADASSISLTDGTKLSFDLVIAGIGATPNTALAEASGLRVANGIVVDGHFRSSDPDIFAAGDCCNFAWRGQRVRLESWKAAQDQGAHAAAAMLGASACYTKVPWFWSDQYDLTLQVVGLFDMAETIYRRETGNDTTIVFQCDRDDRLVAAAGIGTGNAIAKDIRIFEKLIERAKVVAPSELENAEINLRHLLKA